MAKSTAKVKKNQEVLKKLTRHKIPTLITHGEKDSVIDIKFANEMKKLLPYAHIETFAESNHTPYMDEPELYNQAFFARINTVEKQKQSN